MILAKTDFFFLGAAGLFGVYLRYGISLIRSPWSYFAWLETLAINGLGSLVAGMIFGLMSQKNGMSDSTGAILLVGFCGGFTTFSAYSLQNLQLLQNGLAWQAALNLLFAPTLGVAFAFFGVFVSRTLF